jgi:protein involved in polysaccharide export with SLBB domain
LGRGELNNLQSEQHRRSVIHTFLIYFLITTTTICLFGCSSNSAGGQTYFRDISSLEKGSAETVPEYKLGFGDELEVKFFNNEQFNEVISVRPDGRITLERIGDIYVNGMTPSQLDSLVTVTYADIIRDPDVTVFVRKFGSYQVYVLGEVNKPGGYPVERNMTILQVLAVAGGVPFSGALGSVMVLRQGRNEDIKAVKIDVNSYLAGGRLRLTTLEREIDISVNDFFIQPLDIVYVPRTPIASIVAFLEEIYRGVLPPVDIYLRALWWTRY